MTREELKAHCEKQMEMCEIWAISKGEKPSGKIYEEHKLILELLEQEPTTKNDKVDCEHTDCNNCVNHKYCDYESTTKNDLGVESNLFSSFTEKISEKVKESHEEFIFETIRPYCENVVQMKISKRDLEKALLKYYGKKDLGVDCISRKAVHDMLENLPITVEDKWFNWLQKACMRLAELPSVTPQKPILDKIRAEIIEEMLSHSGTGEEVIQAYADGLKKGLDILDKCKSEVEPQERNDQ